jgi:DNA repair ATPase RecN
MLILGLRRELMDNVEMIINDGPESFVLTPEQFQMIALMSVENKETINETIVNMLKSVMVATDVEDYPEDPEESLSVLDEYRKMREKEDSEYKKSREVPEGNKTISDIYYFLDSYAKGKCKDFSEEDKSLIDMFNTNKVIDSLNEDSEMINNIAEDIMVFSDDLRELRESMDDLSQYVNNLHCDLDEYNEDVQNLKEDIERIDNLVESHSRILRSLV